MKSPLIYCLPLLILSPIWLSAMDIIAHRGASEDAPENTLPAMQLAWEQEADAAELDLWLSRDGKLVVLHDADNKRFAEPVRKIKVMTLEEIQQLDVGAFKGSQFKGVRVPALESILATVPAGKRIVLELKDGPELIPEFARVLQASGLKTEQMCVISFKEDTLRASKKVLPDVPHYFLKGYKADAKTGERPQLEPLLAVCRDAKFEGLNLHFDWPVTPEFSARVKARNLKLLIWTVDDAAVARRLAAAGVDAITTNRPAWLRAQLQKKDCGFPVEVLGVPAVLHHPFPSVRLVRVEPGRPQFPHPINGPLADAFVQRNLRDRVAVVENIELFLDGKHNGQ